MERGSKERRIGLKLDSVSLMFRPGKPAQGMTLTVRRTMQNGRTLSIVRRIDNGRAKCCVECGVYVTVGTSNDHLVVGGEKGWKPYGTL
jgi:hypothetical protein